MRSSNKSRTDTKTKIMVVAFEHFGRFGFEGASIRQIAQESEVNLAAINYHFKSKEGLYWEIMVQTFQELDAEVESYFKSSTSLIELSMKTFDHFLAEELGLKNAVKMMLTEGVRFPENPEQLSVLQNPTGPPGGAFFAQAIQKEIPYMLSQEGVMWGVKAVFGAIFHWAFMSCTNTCVERQIANDPMMTPEQIKKDVRLMVESSIQFLKDNPARFSS